MYILLILLDISFSLFSSDPITIQRVSFRVVNLRSWLTMRIVIQTGGNLTVRRTPVDQHALYILFDATPLVSASNGTNSPVTFLTLCLAKFHVGKATWIVILLCYNPSVSTWGCSPPSSILSLRPWLLHTTSEMGRAGLKFAEPLFCRVIFHPQSYQIRRPDHRRPYNYVSTASQKGTAYKMSTELKIEPIQTPFPFEQGLPGTNEIIVVCNPVSYEST